MHKMNDKIHLSIKPEHIDMLTRIIEAYEHLGVVSTLNRTEGLVVIRGTEDTLPEIYDILPTLPFPVKIQEN
jgi:hypothetical protein